MGLSNYDYTYSILDKTTSDGIQIETFANERYRKNHTINVSVSNDPSAGTLGVYIKSPGSTDFNLIGTIDLTDTTQRIMQFTGYAEAIRFVPLSFDADKTYSIFGHIL